MARTYAQQKAALTRALRSGDSDRVIKECRRTRAEWDASGAWPDDWARWNRALWDVGDPRDMDSI